MAAGLVIAFGVPHHNRLPALGLTPIAKSGRGCVHEPVGSSIRIICHDNVFRISADPDAWHSLRSHPSMSTDLVAAARPYFSPASSTRSPNRSRTPLDRDTVRLSVLIPVFNERHTIESILEDIQATPIQKEIIVVDDRSTDGTRELLQQLYDEGRIDRLYLQAENQGKGAAIRQALAMSTGDIVIVQDADLEYDPADWPQLLEPIVDGRADACFGSRFLGGPHRVLYFWHSVGNKLLTMYSNMLTNLNLTDMETCYKAMRGDLARQVILPRLSSNRFGFEPEVTARLAQARARIYEVQISYSGRTYSEGKKINWRDGVAAFWHITKFNIASSGQRSSKPSRVRSGTPI